MKDRAQCFWLHLKDRRKPRSVAALALFACLSYGGLSAAVKQTPASDHFGEVEDLIEQHRFAEAKTAVLDEIKRHPASVEGYNLLGIIQTNQQDYMGALAVIAEGTPNQSSFDAHDTNNLGQCLCSPRNRQSRPKRSFRPCSASILRTPRQTTTWVYC